MEVEGDLNGEGGGKVYEEGKKGESIIRQHTKQNGSMKIADIRDIATIAMVPVMTRTQNPATRNSSGNDGSDMEYLVIFEILSMSRRNPIGYC